MDEELVKRLEAGITISDLTDVGHLLGEAVDEIRRLDGLLTEYKHIHNEMYGRRSSVWQQS